MYVTEVFEGECCIQKDVRTFQGHAEEWLAKLRWEYLHNTTSALCEVVEQAGSFFQVRIRSKEGEKLLTARWYDTANPPNGEQCCTCCGAKIESK